MKKLLTILVYVEEHDERVSRKGNINQQNIIINLYRAAWRMIQGN